MEINILKESKKEIEVELPNLTLAELLRVYLNNDQAVTFAAWKKSGPSEKPILKVKAKGKSVKKAINDAVNSAVKELDKIEEDFKKMK